MHQQALIAPELIEQLKDLPFKGIDNEAASPAFLKRGLMYWKKQEQYVFNLILFVLVFFQFTTVTIIKETDLQTGIILVGVNLLFFVAMIPYARWVWKLGSYRKSLVKVCKHEIILVSLSGAVVFLLMLMTRIK